MEKELSKIVHYGKKIAFYWVENKQEWLQNVQKTKKTNWEIDESNIENAEMHQ